MVVVRQFPYPKRLEALNAEEYLARNETVPSYIDRSDDVAWMLGCSLLILTMQVINVPCYEILCNGVFRLELLCLSPGCVL